MPWESAPATGKLKPLCAGAQEDYRQAMSLLKRSGARHQPAGGDEDPVVRQYRYLLRTAPPDALDAVHREALAGVAAADRAAVLRTVQEHLVAGLRLDPDDVPGLSRLVVLGERRAPGALLRHREPSTLGRLAAAALASEAAFGLLTGYAGWDGLDPEPAVAAWERAEQGQNWHDARLNPGVTWNHALGAGGGFSDGGGVASGGF